MRPKVDKLQYKKIEPESSLQQVPKDLEKSPTITTTVHGSPSPKNLSNQQRVEAIVQPTPKTKTLTEYFGSAQTVHPYTAEKNLTNVS